MASTNLPSLFDQTSAILEALTQLQSNLSPTDREMFGAQFNATLARVQQLNTELKTNPPSPDMLASPAMLELQAQLEREMSALPPVPSEQCIGTFKVIVVGEAGVGKTTWITRLRTYSFEPKYVATLGVEVMPARFLTPRGDIVLNLWDMAGQEKLRGLGEGYYAGADAAVVVWESGYAFSYEKCISHIERIKRMCGDIPIILVQTKVDLTPEPDGYQCEALEAYPSFAISTKLRQGTREPLKYLVDILRRPTL